MKEIDCLRDCDSACCLCLEFRKRDVTYLPKSTGPKEWGRLLLYKQQKDANKVEKSLNALRRRF